MDLLTPPIQDAIASYVDEHDIFSLFQNMMQRILLQKPVDPIQFMVDFLQKPEGE